MHAWEVLVLFLIPIGGGIPVGVVLAHKYGMSWEFSSLLYFISDVMLACVFEPLMLIFLAKTKHIPAMIKTREAFLKTTHSLIARYGLHPSPFALVVITFGSDPMTGRSVAKIFGHGFLVGWALVILGDMFFFGVIMASTLWLNSILGDGTWTAIIITVLLLFVPGMIRKLTSRGNKNGATGAPL